MDSFESIISRLLELDGFLVRSSVKVDLTKAEKRAIGRASNPRWEIDLVGLKPKTNELWIVECKSFLDSPGIDIAHFKNKKSSSYKRYKLFNEPKTFRVVKEALCRELIINGVCRPNPKVKLVLAAGQIVDKSRDELKNYFSKKNNWMLWDKAIIVEKLKILADGKYENSVVSVVSKILLRRKGGGSKKILYIDMDNVLVDFRSALKNEPSVTLRKYKDRFDEIPGLFSKMKPLKDAIPSFKKLSKLYDTYILSTSPWGNSSAWSDKLGWVKKHLGKPAYKRLILSHHKNLNEGDFLIDDRTKNGVSFFRGEHIHFGQGVFKSWKAVVKYLVGKLEDGY